MLHANVNCSTAVDMKVAFTSNVTLRSRGSSTSCWSCTLNKLSSCLLYIFSIIYDVGRVRIVSMHAMGVITRQLW